MRSLLRSAPLAARSTLLAGCVVLAWIASGCNVAVGETSRGPEPLRSVGDALDAGITKITFPWTAAAGASGSIGEIVQTSGDAAAPAVSVTISAGGTGISLRNDCQDGVRAGGAWTDGTTVDVVEYGAGRCAGWSKTTTGSATSWVRDEYLQGLPPPDRRTTPGVSSTSPGDPAVAQLRKWSSELLDGTGRIALLSRHAPGSPEAVITTSALERIQEDMRQLAADITAAEAATAPACAAPRKPTIEAATAAADLAKQTATAFSSGASTSALDPLVSRYLAAQQESARLITLCAKR